MRLLLDQNLSPKLVGKLADIFPGLESIYDHDLAGATDSFLYDWARRADIAALISADKDFVKLAERFGPPPRVIRIEHCDFPSAVIEQLLRREAMRIHAFLQSSRNILLLRI